MNNNKYSPVWKIVGYSIVVFFAIFTIAPLIWLFYSSFKPHHDIVRNIFSLPTSFYLENFTRVWEVGNMAIYSLNSLFYSTSATVLTTLFAMAGGYALSKFGFKISKLIYGFFSIGLLITVHSVLVPLFIIETKIGIDDTRLGVLIPYIAFGLPFLLFLATAYIRDLPDAVEESAIIDGANYFQVFFKIILPMSIPVVTTMLIFSFLQNWNEFALMFVLTSDKAVRSLPVGINSFAGGRSRDFGLQFASLVIGTFPMIVMYIFFNKQLSKGFSSGAVKE